MLLWGTLGFLEGGHVSPLKHCIIWFYSTTLHATASAAIAAKALSSCLPNPLSMHTGISGKPRAENLHIIDSLAFQALQDYLLQLHSLQVQP